MGGMNCSCDILISTCFHIKYGGKTNSVFYILEFANCNLQVQHEKTKLRMSQVRRDALAESKK